MADLTEAQFLKDVSDHQLELLRDDGLYRHLRFAKPGSIMMSFELVTWPGYLCFCGDMRDFLFTRIPDMFNFFRSSRQDRIAGETLYINTGYWGGKCVAVVAADGIRK